METCNLIKVKPSRINRKGKSHQCPGKKVEFYDRPNKIVIEPSTQKRHHLLIEHEGVKYYSYELNSMYVEFDYDISKIWDIKTDGVKLFFSTEFGSYQVGTLEEIINS